MDFFVCELCYVCFLKYLFYFDILRILVFFFYNNLVYVFGVCLVFFGNDVFYWIWYVCYVGSFFYLSGGFCVIVFDCNSKSIDK